MSAQRKKTNQLQSLRELYVSYVPQLVIERWDEVAKKSESEIPKLILLRSLRNTVHALTSKKLSRNQDQSLEALRSIQNNLELLLHRELSGDLLDLLLDPHRHSQIERTIPDQAKACPIPTDRLSRYDRKWERELVAAALQEGWLFLTLDLYIDVLQAESFDAVFSDQIWPEGFILFAETSPTKGEHLRTINDQTFWFGRWYIAHSKKTNPQELDFKAIPGAHSGIEAVWNPLPTDV